MPPNPLPLPTDPCYSPLGIASLPDSSFTASAEQQQHPAHAARLHPFCAVLGTPSLVVPPIPIVLCTLTEDAHIALGFGACTHVRWVWTRQ